MTSASNAPSPRHTRAIPALAALIIAGSAALFTYAGWLDDNVAASAHATLAAHAETMRRLKAQGAEDLRTLKALPMPDATRATQLHNLRTRLKHSADDRHTATLACNKLRHALTNTTRDGDDIVFLAGRCEGYGMLAARRAGRITAQLERWRALASDPHATCAALKDDATRAEHDLHAALTPDAPLMVRMRAQLSVYPHRAGDLNARVANLRALLEHIHATTRALCDQAPTLKARAPGADVVAFDRVRLRLRGDARTVRGLLPTLPLATADLGDRLDQLDVDTARHLTRLTRTPTYYVWLGERHDLSSAIPKAAVRVKVTPQLYLEHPPGRTIDSGSPLHASYRTAYDEHDHFAVAKREVVYTHTATLAEVTGTRIATPKRAATDEATFTRWLNAATALHRIFPRARVIAQPPAWVDDPDQTPHDIDLTVALTLDLKLPGTYTDETARTPLPRYLPLHLIGRPGFGHWRDPTLGPAWVWNPSARAPWAFIQAEGAPGDGAIPRAQVERYRAWHDASPGLPPPPIDPTVTQPPQALADRLMETQAPGSDPKPKPATPPRPSP